MYLPGSKYSHLIPYKKNLYTQEMIDAVVNYMKESAKSRYYLKDEECTLFEKEFADFCGRKFAISTTSGTASLHISLLASGVERDDEVVLTPHVAYAVGNAVLCLGAKPVFVDIDDETLTIDSSNIQEKITPKTKAIIPVHTYGHPADIESIVEVAHKYDLFVIEDVTHAVGSKYKGRRLPLGGYKNIGIFSFNRKQFWLPSGGGMVVTDNEEIAEKAMQYRDPHHGPIDRSMIGYSYTMAGSAAAVGRIELRNLEEYVKNQRSSANILTEILKETPVVTPVEKDWAYHSYARYAIRAPKRDELVKFLKQQGIDCRVLYSTPTHLLKLYQEKFGYKEGDFPVTEKEKKEELSLPEPNFRNRWEVEYIAKKIVEFFARREKIDNCKKTKPGLSET
jgi:dTDP-4-amino-4,6-dideoxygalactose transaminase